MAIGGKIWVGKVPAEWSISDMLESRSGRCWGQKIPIFPFETIIYRADENDWE